MLYSYKYYNYGAMRPSFPSKFPPTPLPPRAKFEKVLAFQIHENYHNLPCNQ
jgi:hypothetical protein